MTIGNLLAWLIIGGVAGWLASMVMRTNAQQGTFIDIVVGIIGAFIGGFVFDVLDIGGPATAGISGFNIASLVTAFIGAIILLGLLRLIRRA
jgi:uncharacterized membrane protein YeaQ/YmgE (transglycosylase-associated protein family)